ncbi:MAG: DEAD/DEAH box helicase [Planctomycetia bacterium]|nr:DEAD/DEAH box helicase [Planctomycetia bacterium]
MTKPEPSQQPAPAARPGHVPFASLGLSAEVLKAVEKLGFEETSPIQSSTIPLMLGGHDVVGQSETGSGKTAAFCIPTIERIDPSRRHTQALILVPTRELATQVADEVHKLAAFKKGLRSVPIYGGASYERQFAELSRGAHIVVGTPGRLTDHLARQTLDLSSVRMLVLDEADRMLDMGFRDDIEKILAAAPPERQTVFFSATISPPIQALVRAHSRDARTVKIAHRVVSGPPLVEQVYYEVRHHAKFDTLARLIDFHDVKSGVIFCNTQHMVEELADALVARGCSADRLHGGMAQAQRTRVMNAFKKAAFSFLVATDVAARGIDVNDLELVVNYDLPYDAEDYVHRIGRTGRAGRKGRAISLVSGAGIYKLQSIERFTKSKIRREQVPSAEAVESRRSDALYEKLLGTLAVGEFPQRAPLVERLLEQGYTPTEVAAAILHHFAPPPAAREPAAVSRDSSPDAARSRSAEQRSRKRRPGPARRRPPRR